MVCENGLACSCEFADYIMSKVIMEKDDVIEQARSELECLQLMSESCYEHGEDYTSITSCDGFWREMYNLHCNPHKSEFEQLLVKGVIEELSSVFREAYVTFSICYYT